MGSAEDARTKSAAWMRMRRHVVTRDNGLCWICGQGGADSADHVVPLSQGGTDNEENLAAVHHNVQPRCNRVRGSASVEVARQRLRRKGVMAGVGAGAGGSTTVRQWWADSNRVPPLNGWDDMWDRGYRAHVAEQVAGHDGRGEGHLVPGWVRQALRRPAGVVTTPPRS
jgi:hypothetical protein